MKAADLKYKIQIWRQNVETTDFGRTNISYEYKCSTRARVNYLTGNRTLLNDEIFYSIDREFIVRSYVPVENTDIIKFDGGDYQILSIDKIHEYNDIVIRTTLLQQHIPIVYKFESYDANYPYTKWYNGTVTTTGKVDTIHSRYEVKVLTSEHQQFINKLYYITTTAKPDGHTKYPLYTENNEATGIEVIISNNTEDA